MYKIIELAHKILEEYVKKGDTVIDATCGNGYDTLFLSNIVGDTGIVYSYDIQPDALKNAKQLNKDRKNIKYILNSHENVELTNVKAIIFNFGYLPNGDKKITTKASTSLVALKNIIQKMEKDLLIVMVLYPGHEEGNIEARVIKEYADSLSSKDFLVSTYYNSNQHNSPFLISIVQK